MPPSAKQFNIECRHNGSSHHVFGFPNVEMDVPAPAHRPINSVYIPPVSDAGRCREGIKQPYPFDAYSHVISQIPKEDSGGLLITFPDLPGCMSDEETEDEAVANGKDALKLGYLCAQRRWQRNLRTVLPSEHSTRSIRQICDAPAKIRPHAKLAERAKAEGGIKQGEPAPFSWMFGHCGRRLFPENSCSTYISSFANKSSNCGLLVINSNCLLSFP